MNRTIKAIVTNDCISCGECVDVAPDVFEISVIPPELQDQAREAAEVYPVDAIILEE